MEINKRKLWNTLVSYSLPLEDGIRKVVGMTITNNKNPFMTMPLNKTGIFAYESGILHATVKLAGMAHNISEFTDVDNDLLMAGAMLYYMGKIETQTNENISKIPYGVHSEWIVNQEVERIMQSDDKDMIQMIDLNKIRKLSYILISSSFHDEFALKEAAVLHHLNEILMS